MCREILRLCLLIADQDTDDGKVTASHAIQAYDIATGRKPGDRLQSQTLGFHDKLKGYLEQDYLDIQEGFTPESKSVHKQAKKVPRPTADVKEMNHPSGKKFCVWHARNLFSSKFFDELFAEYNDYPFYLAKPGALLERRFGRAVSFTSKPSPMVVHDQLQDPALHPSPKEEKLLALAKRLAGLQREYIEEQFGGVVGSTTFDTNLLHVVAGHLTGSSYSAHVDSHELLNSHPNKPFWMKADKTARLPTQKEQQTLTWYFCNCSGGCRITWRDGKRKLGHTIDLGSNGMHWQGPGSQEQVTHEVNPIP